MDKELRERLADALSMRGGAIPTVKCDEFYALMEEIFTPEEAEFTVTMPFGPSSVERIAEAAGKSPAETEDLLERMANKGLVFVSQKGEGVSYSLMPLLPGIFEFQFMKGEKTDRDKKMARLFADYFNAMRKTPSSKVKAPSVPFARVIPIDKEVKAGIDIFPYEQISQYIQNSEQITVSTCYCRHHGELLGNPCDKPKEVCFSFGPNAKFVAERGFGRPVSKDEAQALMDAAEEAGLVHCSSNTSKYIDFVCNCCICHCGILRSMKDATSNAVGANSNYIIEVNKDECTGCETCLERCPMEALSMVDDVVEADLSKCIGCGLCVYTCPSEALVLADRAERRPPPATHRELVTSMIESLESR